MNTSFSGKLLLAIVRFFFFFWHPIFRVRGREHVKKSGRLMICCNHVSMSDPLWAMHALKLPHIPRIMAKKEVMDAPVLGPFLKHYGIFGVDRDNADVNAIKMGLRCLNDDQQMLIFPEGTRVKRGKTVEPKRGAVTLAARTNTPILPVYLSVKRFPFSVMKCVIGQPYMLEFEGKKPTDEELKRLTEELMEKIYKLGDEK